MGIIAGKETQTLFISPTNRGEESLTMSHITCTQTKTGISVLFKPTILDVITSRKEEVQEILKKELASTFPQVPRNEPNREIRRHFHKTLKDFMSKNHAPLIGAVIAGMTMSSPMAYAKTTGFAVAQSKIHAISTQIIDLVTSLAEPILWGFAVVAFLTMVNDKAKGMQKVKSVLYAFVGITLLPSIFAMLSFIGRAVSSAFSGGL